MRKNARSSSAHLSPDELNELLAIKNHWMETTFHSGDDYDEDGLKAGVEWLYSVKKKAAPKLIILDSPLACFEEEKKISKASGLKNGHWLMLHSQACLNSIWPLIEQGMMTSLCTSTIVRGTETEKIVKAAYFLDLLKKHVDAAVLAAISERLFNDLERIAYRNAMGSEENLLMMNGRIQIYDYLRRKKGIICDFLDEYISLLEAGCFLSLFSYEYALVSRRPVQAKIKNMTLHCEDGPAIWWRDGTGLYYLNGIEVPEWLVMTPAEQLDPRRVIGLENVEVRKEIVRKIGADKVIFALNGRVIDTWGEYELIRLDIPDTVFNFHYLRMTNPSTGASHFEGIPPYINSCREALSWRVGGLEWVPEQLT